MKKKKRKTTNTAPTATQITEAKLALYNAVVDCIEYHTPDDVDELEAILRNRSDAWTRALGLVWEICGAGEPRPVKSFQLSPDDFKKVEAEVNSSCLSLEGKRAILDAMGLASE